jgi:hypothetical protein
VSSLKGHLKFSRRLLGYGEPVVHRILDAQNGTLEHRFRHTPVTVKMIGRLLGKEAEREAWLHLFVDWGWVG